MVAEVSGRMRGGACPFPSSFLSTCAHGSTTGIVMARVGALGSETSKGAARTGAGLLDMQGTGTCTSWHSSIAFVELESTDGDTGARVLPVARGMSGESHGTADDDASMWGDGASKVSTGSAAVRRSVLTHDVEHSWKTSAGPKRSRVVLKGV